MLFHETRIHGHLNHATVVLSIKDDSGVPPVHGEVDSQFYGLLSWADLENVFDSEANWNLQNIIGSVRVRKGRDYFIKCALNMIS